MLELKKEQAPLIWGAAKQYKPAYEVVRVFLGGVIFRNLKTGRYVVGYNYCMRNVTFENIDDCIASL